MGDATEDQKRETVVTQRSAEETGGEAKNETAAVQETSSKIGGTETPSQNIVEKRDETAAEDGEADDGPALPPRHDRLEESKDSQVKVDQADPTAKLLSASSWEDMNLKEPLLKGIYAKGFSRPSKIQAVALPLILGSNTHMIAQAKNGSGKTATFALSMISKLEEEKPVLQGIVLSPSRELAKQNMDVMIELARFCNIKVALGCPPLHEVPRGTQVISGTPGKIRDWMKKRVIEVDAVKLFVLDEADVMLDIEGGMGSQVLEISKSVKKRCPDLQLLLFSATFPPRVHSYAKAMAPKANRLTVQKEQLTLDTTAQHFLWIRPDSPAQTLDAKKMEAVNELYEGLTIGQSVIFLNRRETAFSLSKFLQEKGHPVTLICGSSKGGTSDGLDHVERERRMDQFRKGETRLLVTTDLLSRGIDVPQVSLVLNYDLPMSYTERGTIEYQTYLHRVGRTGRFGKQGIAINFVTSEQDMEYIRAIQDYYSSNIKEITLDYEDLQEQMSKLSINGA